ncbi:unnamed protein product [Rotaria sordida]|uniref:Uncharacterized protein n=1 Tax=Rotaria sordida TaxID=392033 RepID=A0A815J6F9_9BILA|nr:unnamed protein product [Rotaria sordida]CAF1378953.1 unnamed protein product [Rotaria sordida]CAF1438037.1 unnamed protein product [Rotaria sordida]CAF1614923.1 unnamed protein product [Rotaria sordida]CAF3828147.1 unnamed protein product [Rotaria sordida]
MNPTWMVANIADELQSFENPLPLRRDTLRRKINRILENETRKNIDSKRTSVRRIIEELKLKPFKLRKVEKLTVLNEQQRVTCAKRLIRKFGARKTGPKWQWTKIIDIDFSGIFIMESFQNIKNNVVYAEDPSEIPAD